MWSKLRQETAAVQVVLIVFTTLTLPIILPVFLWRRRAEIATPISVHSLVIYRIKVILRYIRAHPLISIFRGQSPPRTIATLDILPLVFASLPRADLVNCCQVSRVCFEVASKELYGSMDGVLAGKYRFYRWMGHEHPSPKHVIAMSSKRSLLAGYTQPAEFDLSNGILREKIIRIHSPPWPFWPTPILPFRPSKLKLELLRMIRHLVYATDFFRELDTIDTTSLFPSLHTLTIQHVDHHVMWDQPFLSNLRPKHIRLIHLSTLQNNYTMDPFPLDSAVGSEVEKLTIHFLGVGQGAGGVMGDQTPSFPAGMKQLDLVFMAPAIDTRSRASEDVPLHSFDHVQDLIMSDFQLSILALDVFQLCMMAMTDENVRVRIIGLGRKLVKAKEAAEGSAESQGSRKDGDMAVNASEAGAEAAEYGQEESAEVEEHRDERFTRLLREEFVRIRNIASIGTADEGSSSEVWADRWVEGIDFVSLEEYRGERDYLPF